MQISDVGIASFQSVSNVGIVITIPLQTVPRNDVGVVVRISLQVL